MIAEDGRILSRVRLVCHCLLIESAEGLVLVDCGLGMEDIQHAKRRLGNAFLRLVNPTLSEEGTALRQIEALGFTREDVRHVILTHLDPDHAGGMADFPAAQIHLFHSEHQAATQKRSLLERHRYRKELWDHSPKWRLHQATGETWNGFRSIRAISEKISEILLIPLEGHSRGHCGVAVQTDGDRWLLHAGDAYFHHRQLSPSGPKMPKGLAIYEKVIQHDGRARRENLDLIRELIQDHSSSISIFCSHDPWEFRRMNQPKSTP